MKAKVVGIESINRQDINLNFMNPEIFKHHKGSVWESCDPQVEK